MKSANMNKYKNKEEFKRFLKLNFMSFDSIYFIYFYHIYSLYFVYRFMLILFVWCCCADVLFSPVKTFSLFFFCPSNQKCSSAAHWDRENVEIRERKKEMKVKLFSQKNSFLFLFLFNVCYDFFFFTYFFCNAHSKQSNK